MFPIFLTLDVSTTKKQLITWKGWQKSNLIQGHRIIADTVVIMQFITIYMYTDFHSMGAFGVS